MGIILCSTLLVQVMSALDTFITRVAWAPLDVLVIDMPPGTGDAQITISQRLSLSGAVVVSTPQDLALIDARRGVTMFRKVAVPILGLVENMSWFVCGGCGAEAHIFGSGGVERTAADMGLDVLGKVRGGKREGEGGVGVYMHAREELKHFEGF